MSLKVNKNLLDRNEFCLKEMNSISFPRQFLQQQKVEAELEKVQLERLRFRKEWEVRMLELQLQEVKIRKQLEQIKDNYMEFDSK